MSEQIDAIDIRNAVKRYGDFTALERITLSIKDNEFFTLLGPSGCGKTTLLRMIAGFEDATEGEIFLFGEEIETLPPHHRPVNTVFQNYALFPHMTVTENVMFGLEMRGRSKDAAKAKAAEVLDLVQLSAFAARKPAQLSGGQQQRVALARALAPEPKVLLLDEPLSALDLKLRQAMRSELKAIQRETGITFIFVTHDQEEALTMSDRIAVMSAGRLQQLGGAREIYERPHNRFVADFIGETNLLSATVAAQEGHGATYRLANALALESDAVEGVQTGDAVQLSIRPERINLRDISDGDAWRGVVTETVFVGTDVQSVVALEGDIVLRTRAQNSSLGARQVFEPGTEVAVEIEPGAARALVD